jgi:hypothetical protein
MDAISEVDRPEKYNSHTLYSYFERAFRMIPKSALRRSSSKSFDEGSPESSSEKMLSELS